MIGNNWDQLLKEEFESISRVSNYDESEIYLIVMNNGKKGVYKGNKQIIEQKYQNINYTEKSKLFVVKRNSKYGIFNNKGKEVLAVKYKAYNLAGDYISVETESGNKELYIAIDESGLYSIITDSNTISNNYTYISYAFDNYFIFRNTERKLWTFKYLYWNSSRAWIYFYVEN